MRADAQPSLANISSFEAERLCAQLRKRLIEVVSQTGGHLGSNLGVVEVTVALHEVFDTGLDRLVFDVGHQCYCHKMLTGRDGAMETLRQFEGLSGYPKPSESQHDAFIAGHASNAVSVALGMARARTLLGETHHVIALMGDGALTGGLAYEGLSNAGQSHEKLIVILNDNGMSITKSVGGVATHLAKQRLKPQYLRFKRGYRKLMAVLPLGQQIYRLTHSIKKAIKDTLLPCSLFEDMGFSYLGPVDGHDVVGLASLLRYAKEMAGPVLVHVRTTKGKGYAPAEQNPDAFHGVGSFCVATGEPLKPAKPSFSSVFGETICAIARENGRVCAMTAAMQDGTGLTEFAKQFPHRFFDVGIAEGHAVSMAGGLAQGGSIPIFAVYSTFLQRGFDGLLHDVGILNLHCVFGVDRAGLVGEDGETHHGIFDVAYLSAVPGMTVLAPASFAELRAMLRLAVRAYQGPVAVRYPRGGEGTYIGDASGTNASILSRGQGITLVTYGTTINEVLAAADLLRAAGYSPEIIKINCIVPLSCAEICQSVQKTGHLLVAEECIAQGSVGGNIAKTLVLQGIAAQKIALISLNSYVTQGSVAQLRKLCKLDAQSLFEAALEVLGHG